MLKKVMAVLLVGTALILTYALTQDKNDVHYMPYAGIRKVDRKIMIGQCPAYYSEFYKCVSDDSEICISTTMPVIHWFTPFPKWYNEAMDQFYDELCKKHGSCRAGWFPMR